MELTTRGVWGVLCSLRSSSGESADSNGNEVRFAARRFNIMSMSEWMATITIALIQDIPRPIAHGLATTFVERITSTPTSRSLPPPSVPLASQNAKLLIRETSVAVMQNAPAGYAKRNSKSRTSTGSFGSMPRTWKPRWSSNMSKPNTNPSITGISIRQVRMPALSTGWGNKANMGSEGNS